MYGKCTLAKIDQCQRFYWFLSSFLLANSYNCNTKLPQFSYDNAYVLSLKLQLSRVNFYCYAALLLSMTYSRSALLYLQGNGVIVGLGICGVVINATSSAATLMSDFRTSYICLAAPRAMFGAQLVGQLLGAILTPLAFMLFYETGQVCCAVAAAGGVNTTLWVARLVPGTVPGLQRAVLYVISSHITLVVLSPCATCQVCACVSKLSRGVLGECGFFVSTRHMHHTPATLAESLLARALHCNL